MLDLGIERIGELGIVECIGRIVRSNAAFKLRRTVMSLEDSPIIGVHNISFKSDGIQETL